MSARLSTGRKAYADWTGRSPQDVDDQVAPGVGVKVIRSALGFGLVFVIFKDEVDYYWARSRVLERMNVGLQWLPPGSLHPTMPPLGLFTNLHLLGLLVIGLALVPVTVVELFKLMRAALSRGQHAA